MNRRRLLEWGGVAAGVVLIGFGIASLVLSIAGHNEVGKQLSREKIVGTPDTLLSSAVAAAGVRPTLTRDGGCG